MMNKYSTHNKYGKNNFHSIEGIQDKFIPMLNTNISSRKKCPDSKEVLKNSNRSFVNQNNYLKPFSTSTNNKAVKNKKINDLSFSHNHRNSTIANDQKSITKQKISSVNTARSSREKNFKIESNDELKKNFANFSDLKL